MARPRSGRQHLHRAVPANRPPAAPSYAKRPRCSDTPFDRWRRPAVEEEDRVEWPVKSRCSAGGGRPRGLGRPRGAADPARVGGEDAASRAYPRSMTVATLQDEALALLRELAGPDAEFREHQLEAIADLVQERRRVLCVQRTGWGKSAVYFIATALLRRGGAGPTVLISP